VEFWGVLHHGLYQRHPCLKPPPQTGERTKHPMWVPRRRRPILNRHGVLHPCLHGSGAYRRYTGERHIDVAPMCLARLKQKKGGGNIPVPLPWHHHKRSLESWRSMIPTHTLPMPHVWHSHLLVASEHCNLGVWRDVPPFFFFFSVLVGVDTWVQHLYTIVHLSILGMMVVWFPHSTNAGFWHSQRVFGTHIECLALTSGVVTQDHRNLGVYLLLFRLWAGWKHGYNIYIPFPTVSPISVRSTETWTVCVVGLYWNTGGVVDGVWHAHRVFGTHIGCGDTGTRACTSFCFDFGRGWHMGTTTIYRSPKCRR